MRKGPIKIEFFCDGCTEIQHYKEGSVGCRETGKSLHGLSSILTNQKYNIKKQVVIPTPSTCPYLLKLERKEKLEKINENT